MQPARRARGASAHCTGAAPQVGGGPELLGNHSVTLGTAQGDGAHRLRVSPLCDRAEPGPPRVKRGENLTICLLPRLASGNIGEFSVLVKGRKAAPQAPPGAARRRAAPPEAVLGRGA